VKHNGHVFLRSIKNCLFISMAATKQLRKENEELQNDISKLQKKLDKITEEMLKINDKTDQI
jgi:uncharacterized coiled-coil DUF342 family protein